MKAELLGLPSIVASSQERQHRLVMQVTGHPSLCERLQEKTKWVMPWLKLREPGRNLGRLPRMEQGPPL